MFSPGVFYYCKEQFHQLGAVPTGSFSCTKCVLVGCHIQLPPMTRGQVLSSIVSPPHP